MVFMDTTATIPTGGAAERWKFSAFMIYGCFIGSFMYPIFGNWVWGGGWLAQLGTNFGLGHGHVDFAGSSVVHMQGGVIALIFCWLIGPRHGKYDKNGKIVHPIMPHNIPYGHARHIHPGLRLVWIQSRLHAGGHGPAHRGRGGQHHARLRDGGVGHHALDVVVQDQEAGSLHDVQRHAGRPGGDHCALRVCERRRCRASSASSPVSWSWSRCSSSTKIGIDDAVGAISVHGVNGAWGCLSIGLFADGTYGDGWNGVAGNVSGLFYGGGLSQFWAEAIGVTTCFVTLSILSIIVYYIAEKLVGNRVPLEIEIEGLDVPEMGVTGYSGMVMDKQGETPMAKA